MVGFAGSVVVAVRMPANDVAVSGVKVTSKLAVAPAVLPGLTADLQKGSS